MNASVAIQVLPKVATHEETIRIVDEVIKYIKSFDTVLNPDFFNSLDTMPEPENISAMVLTFCVFSFTIPVIYGIIKALPPINLNCAIPFFCLLKTVYVLFCNVLMFFLL